MHPVRQHKLRKKSERASGIRAGHDSFALGLSSASTDRLLLRLQEGLPFKMLSMLATQSGIPMRELATVIEIPERTLARRRLAGRLSRDESERLLRVARVVSKAVQLFEGNVGAAVTWLRSPQKALSHNTPLNYARFELGAAEVENLIGQLEHGVFS